MTEQQHPITPSPELVKQWVQSWYDSEGRSVGVVPHVATQAARWGADQELEACAEWLEKGPYQFSSDLTSLLRATRRPKPPSFAEQALADLDTIQTHDHEGRQAADLSTIRRALERLQELEGND